MLSFKDYDLNELSGIKRVTKKAYVVRREVKNSGLNSVILSKFN